MPAIPLHPPAASRTPSIPTPLPQLLQTPSGLAIVEIQGTLNSTLSAPQLGPHGSIPLGKLSFPFYDPLAAVQNTAWQKLVYLYVGRHQRLTGEPLAVVRKRGGDAGVSDDGGEGREAMEIVEVVYYKVLFAHRPEPVGGGVEG
ncbi:hypothetical protein LTR91_001534 [Friedmanniomyces endolithicus]|uniref:Chromosome transmission fidelity protein 8 n=1 Tax=Friedmanniomyces endolithicus TaxID=329885 RepID=A0AAN6L2V7_9PEZI|nr:hypothetical protein LTR91_001534 [Friedmanniomyces endolithicus]KAK1052615.1 hypothetical protein LTS16_001683 [Friedmanniomyces endolithicus]